MDSVPYGYHWLDEEDLQAVLAALRSEWITQGPLVEAFEEKVAASRGARFGVAFSSGTAALHAACFAAGIGPGDEVVTTPLTFVGTANAIVYQGGTPVFADIEADSLNIDPAQIQAKLTPRTKAILPVHFAGRACAMEQIHALAKAKGLLVIEDACHAMGAEWVTHEGRREKIGSSSHSDMTAFSFHPVKHITTGEGGMVLTHREDLLQKLRAFRHHGLVRSSQDPADLEEPWAARMQWLGYNYRITDFQCALGIRQLDKLERFLVRRGEIAAQYNQAFEDLELIPQADGEGRHARHLYVVRLNTEKLKSDRKTIFAQLRRERVGVNVHYLPVHLHPYYRRRFSFAPGDFPVAEDYYRRALTLPLFPRMSVSDLDHVIQSVRSVMVKAQASSGQTVSTIGVAECKPIP